MNNRSIKHPRLPGWKRLTFLLAVSGATSSITAGAQTKTLTSHVPAEVSGLGLQPVGQLPPETRLNLAIGLPLHNQQKLNGLIDQLYTPGSPNYRRFLTTEQFTAGYGPTAEEYAAVRQFAQTNNLEVFAEYSNRLVLDVWGKASDIQRAFHVNLRTYNHPTESRQFFAPDVEPSVDASLPISHVGGLNNYASSHPNMHPVNPARSATSGTSGGSAPGGNYRGYDFRNAYAPGVSLTGSGQIVGLFEMEGYFLQDITNYEAQAGLPHVNLQNVLLDGFTGNPGTDTNGDAECSLDIEMAVSMAPGLSKIVVFEGSSWDDILNSMASQSGIKQFGCSWGFSGSADSTMENDFLEMEVQGQCFFLASGDGDAFTGALMGPDDDIHIVTVGGTTLTMNGTGASYASETVWNWGYDPPSWWYGGGGYWGSSGGISTRSSIPTYQHGISMASNQGSTTARNVPDVALTANQVWVVFFKGLAGSFGGTSCAAPLWAGFSALINQQAGNYGLSSVGFLNPALYNIAKGPNYTSCFHDITTGNNFSAGSPSKFSAVTGYDLCTGLGTPNGQFLIDALVPAYAGVVWVDYNYTGSTQNGSYDAPYKTLASGVAAVASGGNIWFKTSGSSTETLTITKAMNVNSAGGSVTVGN